MNEGPEHLCLLICSRMITGLNSRIILPGFKSKFHLWIVVWIWYHFAFLFLSFLIGEIGEMKHASHTGLLGELNDLSSYLPIYLKILKLLSIIGISSSFAFLYSLWIVGVAAFKLIFLACWVQKIGKQEGDRCLLSVPLEMPSADVVAAGSHRLSLATWLPGSHSVAITPGTEPPTELWQEWVSTQEWYGLGSVGKPLYSFVQSYNFVTNSLYKSLCTWNVYSGLCFSDWWTQLWPFHYILGYCNISIININYHINIIINILWNII